MTTTSPPQGDRIQVRRLGAAPPEQRPRVDDLLTAAAPALVTAFTVWAALLSWVDFADDFGGYLRPLGWIALLVAVLGATLRALRSPLLLTLAVQALAALAAATYAITGDALPLGGGATRLFDAVRSAQDTANTYASPIGSGVPPIDPLLIVAGAGAIVVVDLVACSLRRPGLASVPLLVVLAVPIAVLGDLVPWWVAMLVALGFAALLFLGELDAATRWGSSVHDQHPGFRVRTGSVRGPAAGVAAASVVLAVALPGVLPLGDLRLFDVGGGAGKGDGLRVVNPMTDLRRDLRRGADVPVLRVATDDPDPSYLRVAALTVFRNEEWTAGDRQVPSDQQADGEVPGLSAVSSNVRRRTYDYGIETSPDFDSRWLPTPYPPTSVTAEGDWRYDTATMDFLASQDGLNASGMSYRAVGDQLALTPEALDEAPAPGGLVSTSYTELPDGLPPIVDEIAQRVTADAPTDYQAAVALQRFFRSQFTYDLDSAPLGDGVDALEAFLDPNGDRSGYCEQFASAMAVMARDIGIPARVAVGFLRPDRIGPGTYLYSSHDYHAWPELYFAGFGWVRFEPTPSVRTDQPPSWTRGVTDTPAPSAAPEPTQAPSSAAPSTAPGAQDRPDRELPQDAAATEQSGRDPAVLAGTAAGVALVLLAAASPAVVRRRRRARRLEGTAEDAWTELADTARDLGHPWPPTWSVRTTGARLAERLRGTTTAGDAAIAAALDRLVDAVERERYAPSATTAPGALADPAGVVLTAMAEVTSRRRRWRATLLAPSLLRRPSRAVSAEDDRLEPAGRG